MNDAVPHFHLRCTAQVEADRGEWNFVLTAADGSAMFDARGEEPEMHAERLELLAVVRALEALDQPSLVTLTAGGGYVRRVLNHGLDEWRRQDWMWESYGAWQPIKNRDLWQRLDRCLGFHRLETRRTYRVDASHSGPSDLPNCEPPIVDDAAAPDAAVAARRWKQARLRQRRRLRERAEGGTLSSVQIGASFGCG